MNSVLLPLKDSAKRGADHLFFVDATHFIHRVHPAYVWPGKRVFIKASSGKRRYNVLRSLDFATKAVSATASYTCINATSAIDLLNKLLPEYDLC
ncbi:MAG: hypothetical protein LBU32_10085 [Clostridiales bacterium]|nr:hypothetical protein [Clostridiales bacterium]